MKEKVLSSYKLIESVGSGGMSTVYLGRHVKNGSLAAIKVIKKQYTQDENYLKNYFYREIEVTKKLHHKNIVELIDYNKQGDDYYLIYEYVNGDSLDNFLAKNKKIASEKLNNIILQILIALSYAHSSGVVHRDIKPQNILIDQSGIVKITDFGIAKALNGVTVTQTGIFMGSPAYISPEQAEGKKVRNYSDIYSFGVLLFEILAGKLPFTGDLPWVIVNQHINKEPPDIKKINKKLPNYLTYIVTKCLKKEPAARFSSVNEIIEIIRAKRAPTYNEEGIRKTVIKPSGPLKKPKNISKKKVAIGIGASVVVLWFLIGIIFFGIGNSNFSDEKYLNAAENYKVAQYFLIPTAKNSKLSSLEKAINTADEELDNGNYALGYSYADYLTENFPEYKQRNKLESKLNLLYRDKKEEFEVLLAEEEFTESKSYLRDMLVIRGGSDSYAEEQLEVVSHYILAESYIEKAKTYLNSGEYKDMHSYINKARDLNLNYSGIRLIEPLMDAEYEELKQMYQNSFAIYNISECEKILEKLANLKNGYDSYIQNQLATLDIYKESEDYINESCNLASQKKYEAALDLINQAMEANPGYQRLAEVSNGIREEKQIYDGYIKKINYIGQLNQNGSYLEAYNQANSLLAEDLFLSLVLEQDINKLEDIKNGAYANGQSIPGNNVSFTLYAGSHWQQKSINNIFGRPLINVIFSGHSSAADREDRWTGVAIGVNNEIALILHSVSGLERTGTGKNAMDEDKRNNPQTVVAVAHNKQNYGFQAQGRNFVAIINSMSVSNYWFESLNITVSVR